MERLYQVSLDELKKREAERVDIDTGITAAKAKVDEDCVAVIDNFSNVKEEVFETLGDMAEQFLDLDPEAITDGQVNAVESLRADYRQKVRQVCRAVNVTIFESITRTLKKALCKTHLLVCKVNHQQGVWWIHKVFKTPIKY